jgi:hypothetical protein
MKGHSRVKNKGKRPLKIEIKTLFDSEIIFCSSRMKKIPRAPESLNPAP